MLRGKEVYSYLQDHPECIEKLDGIMFQTKIGADAEFRPLEIEDIEFITFEGWQGEKGTFAWYYPCGVPHYCKID